jgi:hypothetical protein
MLACASWTEGIRTFVASSWCGVMGRDKNKRRDEKAERKE